MASRFQNVQEFKALRDKYPSLLGMMGAKWMQVDLVFDAIGGDIVKRSTGLIRTGGKLVTITGPTEARPADGVTIDFVVEPDREQLSELVKRVRDGRARTNIGNVATIDDAVAVFNRTERTKGKTISRLCP